MGILALLSVVLGVAVVSYLSDISTYMFHVHVHACTSYCDCTRFLRGKPEEVQIQLDHLAGALNDERGGAQLYEEIRESETETETAPSRVYSSTCHYPTV